MEGFRHGGDELLADAGEGEREKDDAGEKDGIEGGGPRYAHVLSYGIDEVDVEPMPGARAGDSCGLVQNRVRRVG